LTEQQTAVLASDTRNTGHALWDSAEAARRMDRFSRLQVTWFYRSGLAGVVMLPVWQLRYFSHTHTHTHTRYTNT